MQLAKKNKNDYIFGTPLALGVKFILFRKKMKKMKA